MIAKKQTAIVALAVCSLALASVGSVKHPVTRPLRGTATARQVINLTDGTWKTTNWGECSHLGLTVAVGTGTGYGTAGSGITIAANGDQLFWVIPGKSWYLEINGGTGRFENVTGGFNVVSSTEPIVTYPDQNTMVLTFTYTFAGVLTY